MRDHDTEGGDVKKLRHTTSLSGRLGFRHTNLGRGRRYGAGDCTLGLSVENEADIGASRENDFRRTKFWTLRSDSARRHQLKVSVETHR